MGLRGRRAVLLAALATTAMGATGPATYASTAISGDIDTDTTWTAAGSPYLVSGQVKVTGGHSLTIEPGASVLRDPAAPTPASGGVAVVVSGTLAAEGTSARPITVGPEVAFGVDPLGVSGAGPRLRVAHADFDGFLAANAPSLVRVTHSHFTDSTFGIGCLAIRQVNATPIDAAVTDSSFEGCDGRPAVQMDGSYFVLNGQNGTLEFARNRVVSGSGAGTGLAAQVLGTTSLTIHDNLFQGFLRPSGCSFGYGCYAPGAVNLAAAQTGSVTVEDNDILTSIVGVDAFVAGQASLTLHRNNLIGNRTAAVRLAGNNFTGHLDATQNWWDTADTAEVAHAIIDQTDDPARPSLPYAPVLGQAAAGSGIQADRTPPTVTFTARPGTTTSSSSASFAFSADDADATFECRLDDAAWDACTSPKSYERLDDGSYTFRVRASDLLGNQSVTSATFAVADPPNVAGSWTPLVRIPAETTYPATPRPLEALDARRVLILPSASAGARATIVDVQTGAASQTGPLTGGYVGANSALTPGGKVIRLGTARTPITNCDVPSTAEILDPNDGTWSTPVTLPSDGGAFLSGHPVTLDDGRIFALGGYCSDPGALALDPATRAVSALAPPAAAHLLAPTVRLANGRVLVAGGYTKTFGQTRAAELYDPVADTWSDAGELARTTVYGYSAAVALRDGRALVLGGQGTLEAETFTPSSGRWTGITAPPLTSVTSATRLADGSVLAVGFGQDAASAAVWDPGSGDWTPTGRLPSGLGPTDVVALADGSAVVVPRPGNASELRVLRFVPRSAPVGRVSEQAPAGGSVQTAAVATPEDPVGTKVQTPTAGTVSIEPQAAQSQPAPTGYALVGQELRIEAPTATTDAPLQLTFRVDASLLTSGTTAENLTVFRNGTAISACTGPDGKADPDPCVTSRRTLDDGDAQIAVLTSHASRWSLAAPAPTRGGGGGTGSSQTTAPPTTETGGPSATTTTGSPAATGAGPPAAPAVPAKPTAAAPAPRPAATAGQFPPFDLTLPTGLIRGRLIGTLRNPVAGATLTAAWYVRNGTCRCAEGQRLAAKQIKTGLPLGTVHFRLTLGRPDAAYLARRGRLPVRLVVTLRAPGRSPRQISRRLTLRK